MTTVPLASMNLPRHVAIIMDGNGRWAQARDLPRIEGHRRGVSTVRMVTETASELKLDAITLYCLSSENWKRPQAELDFLMQLLQQYLVEERRTIRDQNMRLRFIGRQDRLGDEVTREIAKTRAVCKGNTGTELVLAVDYGGRDELTRATRQLVSQVQSGEITADEITEERLDQTLDTAGLPEVDLMIRTGGDIRISNYLLWQISYAELYFTPKCWPEFEREDFQAALDEFGNRQRRFGGLNVGA
ncbi:polyprenyl diphosphate synthase [Rhodopirellula halodulae]|uniref:polyprenyl diphosphate synthase n=1 Tax=Rhodopirellula halodulae TaxID=2894198 RepID=UPI001E5D4AB6|nr:polyprenyl diphosphate synthase [Rhodopirellula sp. JC737]MCC9654397.1 di-trans,poly-cis-decaprenylcistransferase [Rhodopirellula sp. JC737]